jgi:hypothetical protein
VLGFAQHVTRLVDGQAIDFQQREHLVRQAFDLIRVSGILELHFFVLGCCVYLLFVV